MLKSTYMDSRMVLLLPSIPQVAHFTRPYLIMSNTKPIACFEQRLYDVVWMHDKYMVYGIYQDYFPDFYVCILYRRIVFLPGNMLCAGGFDFVHNKGRNI